MREAGFPGFQITELDFDKTIVPAGERQTYVPIDFVEPFRGNETALGYDLNSNAIRREAIEKARDSGDIVATARIKLVQEGSNQFGLLVLMPIYRNGLPHETLDERRLNISGYVLAVFNCDGIVKAAMNDKNRGKLDFRLIDETAPAGEQLLFTSHTNRSKSSPIDEKGLFGINMSLKSSSAFTFGDRQWRFEISPTADYLAYHRFNSTSLFLLIGLSLTCMVGAFGMVSSGRASLLRQLVEERTAALAQSEERFRSTFMAAPIGVTNLSLDGSFQEVNQGFCELVGYTRDELLEMTYQQITAPEYQQSNAELIKKTLAGESSGFNFEKQYILKNGERVWVNLSLRLICNADGLPDHFITVVENIDRRKQAEAEIVKSLSLLYATLEATDDAILVVNLNNAWILHNQRFVDMWHITDEIIAAKDDSAALSYVLNQLIDADVFLSKVHELYASPEATSFDILKFKDGKIIERYSIPQRIDGKVAGRLWSFRDITKGKMAEQTLQRECEKNLALLHNASDGIYILDYDGYIIEASDSFCTMLGYDRDEVIGMHVSQWEAKFIGEEVIQSVRRQFEQKVRAQFETRHRRKDGTIFDVEVSGFPLELDGKPVLFNSSRDITARKASEVLIADSRNLLLTVIDTVPIRVFWKDRNSRYLGCNQAFAKDAGMTHPRDVIGKDDYQMGWAVQAELYRADDRSVMDSGIAKLSYDEPQTTPDGQMIWLRTSKVQLKDYNNEVCGVLGVYEDITIRKQAEEKISLAASVFSHTREGIMITAIDGAIIDVNDAFTHITGFKLDEVSGRNPRILSSGHHGKEFYAAMWRNLIEKGEWSGEVWNQHKNGKVYIALQTISVVRDASGNTQYYVALFSDITLIKAHENELEHIAHYDALTNLPNRVLLADRLHQGMLHALRHKQPLGVAFIDLDGFKAINDNHGHEVGDQFLMALATRMKQALREGDTLARLGGDEFVAVMADLENVEASVPMLVRLLAAAAQPVKIGDINGQVSASLGITLYPQAEDVDADQLIRQADQAMYMAKQAGKNRYHVFNAQRDKRIRRHHENLEFIRRALREQEFVLYYQPKVNMRTGTVIGAEALVRWQHPEKGLLPPSDFLPVIEDHPLAVELGEWVIDAVLTQTAIWQDAGLNIPVSVNIGARQLQQKDFVERLCKIQAAHPEIKLSCLELEALETSALEDLTHVSHVIEHCREIGVMFALDDFGTGFSSLTYLKCLPAGQLKIDQSFVHGMLNDPDDLAIVNAVIDLAITFRRQVIAEGVETVKHGEMLLQLGCELAQGYGIAHPCLHMNFPVGLPLGDQIQPGLIGLC